MKKYVILTDSACDLPQEMADQHHIDILCFKLALDGEGYTERVDFTPEQFSEMLRHTEGMPTTSQITQYEFLEKFEQYASEGMEEVLYVSINATGSATNANAHAAKAQFHEEHPESGMRIEIVDSHSYSVTYGIELCAACEKLEAGESLDDVIAYLNDRFARLELVLTAYTLKVIRKSGRISAAAAIAGDLLGIRPIFTLIDGVSKVVKKGRGDKQAMAAMVSHCKANMIPGTPYYIGVTNRKYEADYAAALEESIGYPPKDMFHLGSAVCSNTGPEAVGILFEGQKRER
ncbi:MAG: DegV family protein [Clostridia bacterium]|nr:DegV family protein [Clostridia bacterium]